MTDVHLPAQGEPVHVSHRIDLRPSLWGRILDVFRRGSPRTMVVGFAFGSHGPGEHVEVSMVEVMADVPDGIDALRLDFEVYVNGQQRLDLYPSSAFAAVMERKP